MRTINLLLISIIIIVLLIEMYFAPLANYYIASYVLNITELPIEFSNRLTALYSLCFLIPSLLVVIRKTDSIIESLVVIVIGGMLIAIELAIFFDTRWNTDEISALRWFQSLWLISCSISALLNYLLIKIFGLANGVRIARFWLITAIAFLFFAFDERFHLHEKIADVIARLSGLHVDQINGLLGIQYFDALVMTAYLLLAICFIIYFCKPLINQYICRSCFAYRYLIIGAMFAILSVLADLALFEHVNMSAMEELFEFSASSFFILGFSVNIIEFAQNNHFISDIVKKYNVTRL